MYTLKTNIKSLAFCILAQALLLLPAFSAMAEEVVLTARITPETVPFGGEFKIIIEVERDADDAVVFPREIPQNEKTRPIKKPKRSLSKTEAPKGRVTETLEISMLALDFEEVKTPALVLKDKKGNALEVAPLTVKVEAPKEEAPNDQAQKPKTNEALPFEPERADAFAFTAEQDWRLPIAFLCFFLLGLLVFALRFIMSRLPEKKEAPAQEVVVKEDPAHVQALRRLDTLLGDKLLEDKKIEPFVTRLMNEVLRFYIGKRFALRAEQSTTRELAELLLEADHANTDAAKLREILNQADLVKFARADLQAGVAKDMATSVRAFIESTKVIATEPKEGAA